MIPKWRTMEDLQLYGYTYLTTVDDCDIYRITVKQTGGPFYISQDGYRARGYRVVFGRWHNNGVSFVGRTCFWPAKRAYSSGQDEDNPAHCGVNIDSVRAVIDAYDAMMGETG